MQYMNAPPVLSATNPSPSHSRPPARHTAVRFDAHGGLSQLTWTAVLLPGVERSQLGLRSRSTRTLTNRHTTTDGRARDRGVEVRKAGERARHLGCKQVGRVVVVVVTNALFRCVVVSWVSFGLYLLGIFTMCWHLSAERTVVCTTIMLNMFTVHGSRAALVCLGTGEAQ